MLPPGPSAPEQGWRSPCSHDVPLHSRPQPRKPPPHGPRSQSPGGRAGGRAQAGVRPDPGPGPRNRSSVVRLRPQDGRTARPPGRGTGAAVAREAEPLPVPWEAAPLTVGLVTSSPGVWPGVGSQDQPAGVGKAGGGPPGLCLPRSTLQPLAPCRERRQRGILPAWSAAPQGQSRGHSRPPTPSSRMLALPCPLPGPALRLRSRSHLQGASRGPDRKRPPWCLAPARPGPSFTAGEGAAVSPCSILTGPVPPPHSLTGAACTSQHDAGLHWPADLSLLSLHPLLSSGELQGQWNDKGGGWELT